jgi:phospholipase A-2-activating protein
MTGCHDSLIRHFDNEGELIRSIGGHNKAVISLDSFTYNNNNKLLLLSGSWDGSARVWDLATGENLFTMDGHENRVCVLGMNLNGSIFPTGSAGQQQGNQIQGFQSR